MPIDPGNLRKIIDQNDEVTTGIKGMNEQLAGLDPRSYDQTAGTVKMWTKNVHELKANLEKQQDLSKAMRESARIEDEQHGESYRDKFTFLVDRLKSDIRFFYHSLQEFVDLPQDFTRQRTWDHYIHDMEMEMKKVLAASQAEGLHANLDSTVGLLNFRDAVMALLLNGLLFQKAVLDWDLKLPRTYADGPMVEMYDCVVNQISKSETVSNKFVTEIPGITDPGPFTYDKKRNVEKAMDTTNELSPLQCRLLTVLREMQSLDKGLRNMKFGQQVNIPDKHRATGKNVAADELRGEVTKWFKKFQALEHELQMTKAQRHTPSEQQVEHLTAKLEAQDAQNKHLNTKLLKVDGELQVLRNELSSTRRERAELADKNSRMQKENVPMLNQIDKLLGKSREAVDVLTADAELLSNMFREQVKDNRKNIDERDGISKELTRIHRQLKSERLKNQFKEDELQKKETLYLRTMAARKYIHECYLEQKAKITEVEEKMAKREADWQEMLVVVQGRDSEIKHLKEDLRRAHQRIDELEQQKKMCMQEFKRTTGKPYNMLIEQFKAEPSSSPRIGAEHHLSPEL